MTKILISSFLVAVAFTAGITQSVETPTQKLGSQIGSSGRRLELKSLKGAVLFVTAEAVGASRLPLIIHFHGLPSLVESHVAKEKPGAVLITVQLAGLSSAYARPFENSELFDALIEEARGELKPKAGFSSITLTGFSAGYAAIRAILRNEQQFARVDEVLLLDGIHAGYLSDGKTPNPSDLDSFERFAKAAAAGKKLMVITHSEIAPGTYASTTECVDHLLRSLKLVRRPDRQKRPDGMEQLTAVDRKGLHVRGYAGNLAADHVDHLQSMDAWLELLKR